MLGIGTGELIVILIVALIVFGPQKLPELGRAVGKAMAEFRKASETLQQEVAAATETGGKPEDTKDEAESRDHDPEKRS